MQYADELDQCRCKGREGIVRLGGGFARYVM